MLKNNGYFGNFGGSFVPELFSAPLEELKEAFAYFSKEKSFNHTLKELLNDYAGRPTPLTRVDNFKKTLSCKADIYLKREDLLHTGAHKLNNALGQCLLAKEMGKKYVIAETGAGQHGFAVATTCARLGLDCTIYMGKKDTERQMPNVKKMKFLGAKVVPVTEGSQTLKEAVNEAMRVWSASFGDTFYCLGSALGPHPYPTMVMHFHKVIGNEIKKQLKGAEPNYVVACVGGGSN